MKILIKILMLLEKLLSTEVTCVPSQCKDTPREQRDTHGVMAAHYLLQKSSSLFMFNLNLTVCYYLFHGSFFLLPPVPRSFVVWTQP